MNSVGSTLQYYNAETTAKMVGVSRARLRAWARAGLLRPSAMQQGQPHYSFQDLVALRCARSLMERGLSLSSIRKGIEALKRDAPGELPASCLARHRAFAEQGTLGVHSEGRTRQVSTGQMLLNFSLEPSGHSPEKKEGSQQSASAGLLRLPSSRPCASHRPPLEPADQDCAESWYAFGTDCECLCSADSPTDIYFRRAQRAYLMAVELDPTHAPAWTNLGTLHAAVGDARLARHYYEQALEHAPTLCEAICNLAELDLRDGAFESARDRFSQVLHGEKGHLEAMYGLARAHIALQEHDAAVRILEPYCQKLEELDEDEIDDELQARWDGAKLVIASHTRENPGQDDPDCAGPRAGLSLVSGP